MRDSCQCFGHNSPRGGSSTTPLETLRTQTSAPIQDRRVALRTLARRQFLRHLVGVGVLITASTIAPAAARAEKKVPKALVLSCIDYRILVSMTLLL
jgi:site-specific recombinase XerC